MGYKAEQALPSIDATGRDKHQVAAPPLMHGSGNFFEYFKKMLLTRLGMSPKRLPMVFDALMDLYSAGCHNKYKEEVAEYCFSQKFHELVSNNLTCFL